MNSFKIVFFCSLFSFPLLSFSEEAILPYTFYEAIVRIENAAQTPDYRTPWNSGRFTTNYGTGFLIGKNKFLTNAHVVSNSRQLVVRKHGDAHKYAARILHIAHDCDLALFELKDPKPFQAVTPLALGSVPRLQSKVSAIGYSIGGHRISITQGIVSRIDFTRYTHSNLDSHLAIQIDAAINPGNSGGPVIQDGKVVGVAFQTNTAAENTGYMIPTPVIKRFLKDIEDGQYDHYVDLAIGEFPLINPTQRRALNLPNDGKGVLVSSVLSGTPAAEKINVGDILLEIDGRQIASNGLVNMNGARMNMNEIVERKFKGDQVRLKGLRNGKVYEVDIDLQPIERAFIQAAQYGQKPRYIVFAGLVFQPLNRNLMVGLGIRDHHVRYHYNYFITKEIFKEKPEVIVLTNVLPDSINSHLNVFRDAIVDEVNGKKIRDLNDLYKALHPQQMPDFFVIKCSGKGQPIVLEAKKIKEAQERVMKTYNVSKAFQLD